MALSWTLKLTDRLSGPADAGARALGRLEARLKKIRREEERASAASAKQAKAQQHAASVADKAGARQAGAMRRLFDQRRKAAQAWERMGGGGTPSSGMIGVAGVAAGAAIGGAILSIGSSLASKGAELGQRMFEGASMRQDIMAGFSALLGGTSQASAAFEQIKAKAAQIGAPLLDTAKQVQSLLAGGFSMSGNTGAMRVLEATRALKFINPSANVDNVITALSQIQAKGKLMAEELHGQLGDAGVNIGRVYEALAAKLGKKTDDIRRMMQKGSISAADGIAAIFESIEKTGGKSLSELASAGTKNFSSLLERAKALPEELGARMQLGGAITTLSGSLEKIINRAGQLDLSHVFETVAKTIDRLVNIGTKVDLVPMLEKASGAVDRLVAAAEKAHLGELISAWSDAVAGEAFSGFADGFLEVAQFAKALSPDEIRDTAKSFAAIGKVLGGVAAGLVVIATWGPKVNPVILGVKALGRQFGDLATGNVAGAIDRIANAFWAIAGAVTGISLPRLDVAGWISLAKTDALAAARGLGADIMGGIAEGISSATALTSGSLGTALGAVVAAGRLAVGARSPAVVPREKIGRPVGQGVTVGIQREAANAGRALGDLAAGAVQEHGGSRAASSAYRAGQSIGNRLVSTSITGHTTINRIDGVNIQAIDGQIIAEQAIEQFRGALNRGSFLRRPS